MTLSFSKRSLLLLTIFATSSCQLLNRQENADLETIYDGSAQLRDLNRRAVIVIPGVMGSRLVNAPTGQVVWGAFTRQAAKPTKPESARLIAFPMGRGKELTDLTDSVVPDGALATFKVSLFSGFTIQPKAYLQILRVLGVGGYKDESLSHAFYDIDYGKEHYSCFQFGYDWRRSSAENAIVLGQFIKEKKAYIEAENIKRYGKKGNVKFDLVAHSMGNLVARYYLRYGEQGMPRSGKPVLNWAGSKDIAKLIMVAPPNSGAVMALRQLVHGISFGPFTFKYPASILATMPAVYELLPRGRHRVLKDTIKKVDLDPLDPKVWLERNWGLADPRESNHIAALLPDVVSPAERAAIARDHMVKCLRNARRFQNALDVPSEPPSSLELILFAGDAVTTPVQAEAWPGRVKYVEYAPGDDTVARYSALGDERFATRSVEKPFTSPVKWHHATFLFEHHIGITQSRTFADNLLFELLEKN